MLARLVVWVGLVELAEQPYIAISAAAGLSFLETHLWRYHLRSTTCLGWSVGSQSGLGGKMKIKIYGLSTYNSQRVTLALLEFGIQDFELVKVDIMAKEHLNPSFLSIQPFHQLPVYESGNFRLYESRAIVRYIAQKFGNDQGPSLLGKTLEEQALVNQWVEVEAHRFNDAGFLSWSLEYFYAWKFNRPLKEEFVSELYEKLTKVFDVYEDQLSKSKYLAGDFYSMADLSIAPSLLRVMVLRPELITGRDHVKAWYDDITSRSAFKKMLEADAGWAFEYGPLLPVGTQK